jgi:hypothetical protein
LAQICSFEVQYDPTACHSRLQVNVISNGPSDQIVLAASGGGKTPGGWEPLPEPFHEGSLWTRHIYRILDVSDCAATQDCSITINVVSQRSTFKNLQAFQLVVDADFGLYLSNTPWNYLPEDATEEGTFLPTSNQPVSRTAKRQQQRRASTCMDCPDGKLLYFYANIQAHPYVYMEKLRSKITFELFQPKGVVGYQPGSSSNFGYSTQSASTPDYGFFEFVGENREHFDPPTSNGQSIVTKQEVLDAAVALTSLDFGGATLMRAKATIDGNVVYAQPGPIFNPADLPIQTPACAVEPGDNRGFIQIPIDYDCNGIADSWEWDKAWPKLNARHFPKYWDEEATTTARPEIVRGDGYGAFDEYRGFMVLDPVLGQLHQRTDPVMLTTFFHDKSPDKSIATALRNLLIPKLAGEVEFFELAEGQFRALPGRRSDVLNRFSNAESDQLKNYPMVFNPDPTQPTCTTPDPEVYGSNENIGKDFWDITVCSQRITVSAQAKVFPVSHAIAIVSAHEAGHRFNLRHYSRLLIYHPDRLSEASAITAINNANGAIYVESSEITNQGKLIFYMHKYRAQSAQGLNTIIPVERLDLIFYPNSEDNSALSGFVEDSGHTMGLLDNGATIPLGNTPELGRGVSSAKFLQPLSSSARYKQQARIDVYERTGIMTAKLVFDPVFAETNLANYDFITSSESDKPQDKSMIQLNK